jgi:peptide/nickel transport system substrate-binding protein
LPSLAKSWTVSPDGMTITFKLQDNVKWHDGKPFTSADVQYSIIEVLKKVHPRGASTFKEVIVVEMPDASTVVFKLGRASPYLMMALGLRVMMVPKHLIEEHRRARTISSTPVGTRRSSSNARHYVRLDRTRITGSATGLSRSHRRALHRDSAHSGAGDRRGAHRGFGAIPIATSWRSRRSRRSKSRAGLRDVFADRRARLQHAQAPFNNEKVRQAISFAVDRKFVIDNVWFGFETATADQLEPRR